MRVTGSAAPTLEVVICTYNNAGMLDEALAALGSQQPRNSRWACLVVNNNCTDRTPAVVDEHIRAGAIPGLRAVSEPEQGLTAARLRGVRSSQAAWIAFVDDDCVLRADWIANALSFAESHPSAGAFGGRVILDFLIEPARHVRALGYSFAEQDRGSVARAVPFLVGAGLVVNRNALSACGWAAGPLLADRIGPRLVSGGDVEIVLRIASLGRELWYEPGCELRHRIPPRRTSLRYLTAINRGLGVSQSLADAMVHDGSPARWALTSARRWSRDSAAMARLAVSAALGRRSLPEAWIQAGFRLGQLEGIWRILRMSPARRRVLLGAASPETHRRAACASAA